MDRPLHPPTFALIVVVLLYLWSAPTLPRPDVKIGVVDGVERELAVSNGKLEGRFSPFYRCVFDRVDRAFTFVEMPLAQLLYQLETGRVAAGLPLVQTADRDQFADFGGRLFQTEYVYLLLKDLPPLEQASGLTYAFVRRFIGRDLMKGVGSEVRSVSEWTQAVSMLKLERADVVVVPWVLVDQLMEGFDGEYFVRTAAWVDLSLYVSHAHSDGQLSAQLRQAIRQCRYDNDIN